MVDVTRIWKRRVIVAVLAGIIAFAGYYAAKSAGWIDKPPCESGRLTETDAQGRITKIMRRACPD